MLPSRCFAPTLTVWGGSVRIVQPKSHPRLVAEAHWHGAAPRIDVTVPGFQRINDAPGGQSMELQCNRQVSDKTPGHTNQNSYRHSMHPRSGEPVAESDYPPIPASPTETERKAHS